jgi:polyhydroxybutyrate depolymerase
LLHGYQVDGVLQDMFFGLSGLVDELGFLLIRPNGTIDSQGYNFWNGTFACCDRDQVNVDDAGYIHSLIDEMEMYFNVDRSRIYLMGHSNGGFMSYRLACETGDRFAGLMSLAGATFHNELACDGVAPLAVLQVHGTNDTEIQYDGGKIKGIMPYPSAEETVERWTVRNGCGEPASLPNIDIDADIDGAETTVKQWSDCTSGFDVGLWTIQEGKHIPGVYDGRFARAAIAFLFAHQRDTAAVQ